jgi:hypothetical protein
VPAVTVLRTRPTLVALAAIGFSIGAFLGAGQLFWPGFVGAAAAFLLGLIAAPFFQWLARLLIEPAPTIPRVLPSRSAVLAISGVTGLVLSHHSLQVKELRFVYKNVAGVPHASYFSTYLNELISCDTKWFIFGQRWTTTGDTRYTDAVVQYSESPVGLKWSEPPWDPVNRGGVPHPIEAHRPTERAFVGATCEMGNTVAYGWDTAFGESADDRDGAIWLQNNDIWTAIDTKRGLGGPGHQEVVALFAIRGPEMSEASSGERPPAGLRTSAVTWRAVLSLGPRGGARCLGSDDLHSWRNDSDVVMDEWTVTRVAYNSGHFVAIAEQRSGETLVAEAMFTSPNCRDWNRSNFHSTIDATGMVDLVNVQYVAGRWFFTGRQQPKDELAAYPFVAEGPRPSAASAIGLEDLRSNSHRSIYAVAENAGRWLALGVDQDPGLSTDPEVTQDDIVFPLSVERAPAIGIPNGPTLYHPSFSNVDLAKTTG